MICKSLDKFKGKEQYKGVGNVANMGKETRQDRGQVLLDHIADEKQSKSHTRST